MWFWRKLKVKKLMKKYKGVTSGIAIYVLEENQKKGRKRILKRLQKVAEKLPYDSDALYNGFVDVIINQAKKEMTEGGVDNA